MSAVLLPVAERASKLALNLRGFESRSHPTRAGVLHVYDASGSGTLPTTVVLHGLGSAAAPFAGVLTRLRPHTRRVMAPDLPGHGFSAVPTAPVSGDTLFEALCELLQPLGDEPVVLVGNSLGGALAMRYALEHPARVHGLVLVSPAGARMQANEWQALLETFQVQSNADARRLLQRLYHRMPIYMPAFASGLRQSLQRPTISALLQDATQAELPATERLRELTMPILLLWGRSERLLPQSSLAYFREHLPEHTLIEQPEGFGHCPHIDDPARLARRVLDFMSQTSLR